MKFWSQWLRSSSRQKTITCDGSVLIAKSSQELLLPHQNLLQQIRSQVSVPESHWVKLYHSFIESFAELVQELPASESHHHAFNGGLLQHSLEVGLHALQLRSGKLLPLGASPEVISEKQELWSYAVLTAAMMHDIGKPLVDQEITLYDENDKLTRWKPFSGTLKIGTRYVVKFRMGRKYALHETIPPLIASRLVLAEGLNWLSSDMEVLESWMLCLSGRKHEAGILGEIITQADQLSVAENLTGTVVQSLPTAKQIPLYQRLTTGLIYLLDNDKLPLNRKGAAGWEYEGKLWLVSKRVLDELRKHLRDEGQLGIPSDNTRLMDELLQHGVLEATEDSRAIWKVCINIQDWKQEFTCLCISLEKLWDDKERWPTSSDIKVIPVSTSLPKKEVDTVSSNVKEQSKSKGNDKQMIHAQDTVDCESVLKSNNIDTSGSMNSLPLPPGIEIHDKKEAKPVPSQKDKKPEADKSTSTLAKAFIEWLSTGIADGSITVNHVGAAIHIVEEGLLLVSPSIFRNYAKITEDTDYTQVQHAFQSLGINKITPENTNVWKYVVQGKRKKASYLKGMIIDDPVKTLGIRLPPPNPVLSLEHK